MCITYPSIYWNGSARCSEDTSEKSRFDELWHISFSDGLLDAAAVEGGPLDITDISDGEDSSCKKLGGELVEDCFKEGKVGVEDDVSPKDCWI